AICCKCFDLDCCSRTGRITKAAAIKAPVKQLEIPTIKDVPQVSSVKASSLACKLNG
ncbi:unnamed protein product, partial [Allacma fusca]